MGRSQRTAAGGTAGGSAEPKQSDLAPQAMIKQRWAQQVFGECDTHLQTPVSTKQISIIVLMVGKGGNLGQVQRA